MPEQLVKFLDNFPLGSSLVFLGTLLAFLGVMYKKYRNIIDEIKKKGSEETLDKLEAEKMKKELNQYRENITSLQKDIDALKKELVLRDKRTKALIDRTSLMHKKYSEAFTKVGKQLSRTSKAIADLEKRIERDEQKIDVLTDSDINTHRAYIISEYHRAMKDKKIDLITLQSIENIYKKYLSEDKNGGDEFITGLVNEIRNLPTKK